MKLKIKFFLSVIGIPVIVPSLFLYTLFRNIRYIPQLYTSLRLQRIYYNQKVKFENQMKGVN